MDKSVSDGYTWPPAPDFPKNAYTDTAQYYARYRVPYPQTLIDDLRTRAGISGSGRLLDLGCGPGRVSLLLSPYFSEVWAIDLESEMIDVGREEAKRVGATNLRWIVGRAEDLEAPQESFELITIGEAFHRLDQRLIAKRALEWLLPGCCLATMGGYGIMRGKEQWQVLVSEVFAKWSDQVTENRSKSASQPRGAVHDAEVLKAAGFENIEIHEFPHPYVWTLDSIIGNIYSFSGNFKGTLGDKVETFEADMRRTLLAYDSRGQYPETMRFGYTLTRRPRLDA